MTTLFDTRTLAPQDRSELWSEAHERIFFPIGVEFSNANAAHGRIDGNRLGSLHAYRVVSDPSRVRRGRAAIVSSDPEQFLVATSLRGSCRIEQAGRMTAFDAGELSSWDSSRPFEVTHAEAFDLLLVVIPRALLGPRGDLIYRRTAGRIPGNSDVGALAGPFFREVWRRIDAGSSKIDSDDIADSVIALVRALHRTDGAERPPVRRLPSAALLRQMKAHIDQHLGDVRLGPESIAGAHYISTRYLYKLFAADGLRVSEWIRHRRLEACRRDLLDPALAHETISEVARRWGLTNPAHFSRVFHDAYGCTPSELRRTSLDPSASPDPSASLDPSASPDPSASLDPSASPDPSASLDP